MQLSLFFSGFISLRAEELIINLSEKLGASKVFLLDSMIGNKLPQAGINGKFELLDFWELHDFRIGPYETKYTASEALSEADVVKFASTETVALRMLDRFRFSRSLSYERRKFFYLESLRFWVNFVRVQSLKAAFFSNIPHEFHDFILYRVLQEAAVPCVVLQQSQVPDRYFIMADWTMTPAMNDPKLFPVDDDRDAAKLFAKQTFDNMSFQILREPFYMETNRKLLRQQFQPGILLKKFCHDLLELLKRLLRFQQSRSEWRMFLEKIRDTIKRQVDFLDYKRFALDHEVEPELDRSFVYLPLHFQPECTTCPMGGVFVDQLLMVRILANSLPENWILYIKEHPFQTGLSRSREFYQSLVQFDTVRLVKRNYSSAKLIANSKAVATVTGTAGWEALFYFKPVLMFGHFFYESCPGVSIVRSQSDARTALKAIEQGTVSVDKQSLLSFLELVYSRSTMGYCDLNYAQISKLRHEDNIRIMSDTIWQFFAPFGHSLK